jgi:hypothetical protein
MQSQKLAFDRARAARKARSSAWPSFDKDPAYKSNISSSFNPFDNKFGSSQFKYSGAKDSFAQDSLEDWQKAYEDDEHEAQERGFKLQDSTSKIAKEAQEEAQKRAQGQQRRRGVLGLVSSAASFIPGVGPLISAGINAFS